MTDPFPTPGNLALELTPEMTAMLAHVARFWLQDAPPATRHSMFPEVDAFARDLLWMIEGNKP